MPMDPPTAVDPVKGAGGDEVAAGGPVGLRAGDGPGRPMGQIR